MKMRFDLYKVVVDGHTVGTFTTYKAANILRLHYEDLNKNVYITAIFETPFGTYTEEL